MKLFCDAGLIKIIPNPDMPLKKSIAEPSQLVYYDLNHA
jgi:hypothetical protein